MDALRKMKTFINECDLEIGWLGIVERFEKDNMFLIEDVMLFNQEVSSVTTDIDDTDLTKFANDTMKELGTKKGSELLNKVRMWGHSHVNMGVSASGTDDKQMDVFEDNNSDFFIRLIANKKDSMKIDIFDYANGITYLNVDYYVSYNGEEREISNSIIELQKKLESISSSKEKVIEEQMIEEIKEKVRNKKYCSY